MSSGVTRMATGSFVGTGADLNVDQCGFKPRVVRLYNVTGNCMAVWVDSMPDDAMQKTVDSGSGTSDTSYVTANGITPRAKGFAIGADGDLNVASEVVHFEAHE